MLKKYVLRELSDYIYITIGLMLFTFAYNVFLVPYEIVTGGVTGIGALIFYITGFPIQYTYFIINGVLILVALKILGWKFLMKTIYVTFLMTYLFDLAQSILMQPDGSLYKLMGDGNDFMSLVIGCSLTGTGLAIIFLHNGSTGGTDIVAAVVNKYRDISLGEALIALDVIIVGSCLFVDSFGPLDLRLKKVVFGFCTMIVECSMLDYVMYHQRQSVQFLIFSKKYKEIGRAISDHLEHSMTILDGHGWYTGNEVNVICLLAKKNESATVFRLIKAIDPDAFVSQSAVIGVYGEGFDQIKVKLKKEHLNKFKGINEEDSIRNEQQEQAR